MILSEILDSKINYTVERESSGQFKTSAKIGGRVIVFRAELDRGEDGEYWDISFEQQTEGAATYAKTGSGKEFSVMSMVKASLAEFVQRYHPKVVHFSAATDDGAARANVYRRMVSSVLKDYELEETISGNDRLFTYRRN